MASIKKTVLTSVSFAALLTAMGCGDSGKTGGSAPATNISAPDGSVPAVKNEKQASAESAPTAVPTPVVTASGSHVLAFDFNDEYPCAGCIGKVTKALATLQGIKKCDAEMGKQAFTIEYDAKLLDAVALVDLMKKTGHGAVLRVD